MQIAFGRVRRKTSPARKYVRDCYSLKCQHIFGLYYKGFVMAQFLVRDGWHFGYGREHSSLLQRRGWYWNDALAVARWSEGEVT